MLVQLFASNSTVVVRRVAGLAVVVVVLLLVVVVVDVVVVVVVVVGLVLMGCGGGGVGLGNNSNQPINKNNYTTTRFRVVFGMSVQRTSRV